MPKKTIQTSLRIVKCQFCEKYVLIDNITDHVYSNCSKYMLGEGSINESELTLKEIKSKPISSFLDLGNKAVDHAYKKDINNNYLPII